MDKLPLLFFTVLYLSLMTGCENETVNVDTSPIGVGLAAIGVSIVVATWIRALYGKGGEQ